LMRRRRAPGSRGPSCEASRQPAAEIMSEAPVSSQAYRLLESRRRVLLFGEPGVGKSTLAADLARMLWENKRPSCCVSADPGSPAFGVPGTACLGEWDGREWRVVALEALCTLDAGRFRLPLVSAVRRLVASAAPQTLLIDPPGVVRGVAGAELLAALVEAAQPDVVLALVRPGHGPPLPHELQALRIPIFALWAAPEARRIGKRENARRRTALWDAHLRQAVEHETRLSQTMFLGTPPMAGVEGAWAGRQVGVLDESGDTVALGEVMAEVSDRLMLRLTGGPLPRDWRILVRDARRRPDGLLGTFRPPEASRARYCPPPDLGPGAGDESGPLPVVHVGPTIVTLVNGIFGDPLLHIRLRHRRRSLLFDLGEAGRLPARIAHQVTDVFISHAHFDHIAGFLWLLRSRIGDFPPCRMFGPPGLAENVEGMVRGICWDRVGNRAPRFQVAELHDGHLLRYWVQAGQPGPAALDGQPAESGVLLDEPGFRVRAVTLDHGTPVLAFAFECSRQLNVRKERLAALRLEPGPWLAEIKDRLAADQRDAAIRLPDGRTVSAGPLGDDLVLVSPGAKLAYATDLADTRDNRSRLGALARGAHTLFCEAAFAEADADQARNTGHLTARACGEIARAAAVEQLVPFHFSRRYESDPERIYGEVLAACPQTRVPQSLDPDLP
jgi:ribonuclease Z